MSTSNTLHPSTRGLMTTGVAQPSLWLAAAIMTVFAVYLHTAIGWRMSSLFLVGTFAGAFVAARFIGLDDVPLGADTREALAAAGVRSFEGLVPGDIFSWQNLVTPAGLIIMVAGGFLIGFGTAWAGGCTSGHGVVGLADLQLPSLVAVIGFFAGGLAATHFLLPWLLGS